MISWLKHPQLPEVAKYIDCYWLIKKSPGSSSHPYPRLNPDPSAHLILSPQEQAYHYDMYTGVFNGLGSHWLFPYRQTIQLDHSKPFIHLGIKFHVGALYSIDIPEYCHPTLDAAKGVSLTTLLPESASLEQAHIEMALSLPNKCCEELDKMWLPWFEHCKEDQHSKITRSVLPLLNSTPISDLSNTLYCSHRTVERSFTRVTGFTLKQCQSMNKLEAMLEFLYERDPSEIDWAAVALEFGFSDQPHLIRHLKLQIGLTPRQYAIERGLTIDVYGAVRSL